MFGYRIVGGIYKYPNTHTQNMSELIRQEEKKQVSAEEIFPKWMVIANKVLDGGKMTLEERDNLGDCSMCFVGEAWKHMVYGCTECYDYSHKFFHANSNAHDHNIRDRTYAKYWEHLIPEFVQHWNEKHV